MWIRFSKADHLDVLETYLNDLADDDLLLRPSANSDPLAWQLGHLIATEAEFLRQIRPDCRITLPPGFADQHSQESLARDSLGPFLSKDEYIGLYRQVRAVTIVELEGFHDGELDVPSPPSLRDDFPTIGHVFTVIALHPMMHAGQFSVVRRQLGKPVLI